jgi:hypothetical protein
MTNVTGTYMKTIYILIISRSVLIRIRKVLDKAVEKIKTRNLFNFFFSKIGGIVDRYSRAEQATDNRMAHPYSILDT